MAIARAAGWLVRLLVAVIGIALLGVVLLVGAVTARGLPQTSGTLHVPGLHAPVTVARDRAGIVQITADDPHDLFLAQGFVHAQERMWQMEISRRIGAGRLSELFGDSTLETDRFVRALGWRQAAEHDLGAIAPDVQEALQAYADGVNAWIDAHQGNLPLPFVVAGLTSGAGGGLGGMALEPWTPLDTATWQKVQAWSLGSNYDAEVFRMLADARLGNSALTDELFPPYDAKGPIITPSDALGSGLPTPTAAAEETPAQGAVASASDATADTAAAWADLAAVGQSIAALAGFDRGSGMVGSRGVGSNNWVVAGSRTASGKPLLANDPHLGLSMPSVWIMNGLHCRAVSSSCPWDVVGVSFPGAPAVILGHNARIAWGATNVGPDTQDLFRETVDASDPSRYVADGDAGTTEPFEVRHEVIRVAGGEDVEMDVRSTRHGPILNDVSKRLADQPLLALQWTTTALPDRTLESFFRINVAATFDEFRAAFDVYGSPSQNFVYADVDGHIGYVLPGLIPVRENPPDGLRPRDGSRADADWLGYLQRDQLPWQLDPPSGLIVTANNRPVDDEYPYVLGSSSEWDPGYRAERITTLLRAHKAPLARADLAAIQMDDHLLRADRAVPALLALRPEPATADGRELLDRIASWDRSCDADSTGCAAYLTWEFVVQRAIFDGPLGPIARDYVGSPPSWQALIGLLAEPGSHWWTSATGAAGSGSQVAPAVVGSALDEAGRQLRASYGAQNRWTWGRLHTIAFREGTFGGSGIGPLEWYFNAPARPVAGASGAVLNTYYDLGRAYPDPYDETSVPASLASAFHVSNGPSYRLTIDMADLDAARIVITTGQSGNPFDRHYGDLIDTWARGGTLPLPFSPDAVRRASVSTLTLAP